MKSVQVVYRGDGHLGGATVVPVVRGIAGWSGAEAAKMAIGQATVAGHHESHLGVGARGVPGSRSVEASEGLADVKDKLAVDELLLAAGSVAEGGTGEAVNLAQGALGELVEGGEGVVGEEVALASCVVETEADVFCGVGHRRRREQEAVMDTGEQGPVCSAREVLLQLGETDEYDGQERLRVPLVIQHDVEVGAVLPSSSRTGVELSKKQVATVTTCPAR
jgi:hypothetical protein